MFAWPGQGNSRCVDFELEALVLELSVIGILLGLGALMTWTGFGLLWVSLTSTSYGRVCVCVCVRCSTEPGQDWNPSFPTTALPCCPIMAATGAQQGRA